MEGPERRGAGPESTGINNEQLNLSVAHGHEAVHDYDGDITRTTPDPSVSANATRSHALAHRPNRLHTRDHPGARGDRLEGNCQLRDQRND